MSAVTHVHEQKLHLVLSNPPSDALPRPKPERQRAKPCHFSFPAVLPVAAPPAGVEAQWMLKHLGTPSHRVKTGLDHSLWGKIDEQTCGAQ